MIKIRGRDYQKNFGSPSLEKRVLWHPGGGAGNEGVWYEVTRTVDVEDSFRIYPFPPVQGFAGVVARLRYYFNTRETGLASIDLGNDHGVIETASVGAGAGHNKEATF
jgi:hypothetical protein